MSILKIQNLKKDYIIKKLFEKEKNLHALKGIDIEVHEGKTLGIVGESGCGKSTLAKVLTKLENKTSGEILFDNNQYERLSKNSFHEFIQMVFQDPYQSLNPRKNAFQIVSDPLNIQNKYSSDEIHKMVKEIFHKVGLSQDFFERYPHQFSGGQRQRLGIARALMLKPKVLILDEPVSALDVSIQAQVLNLLVELQKEFNLTYLFISHDLSVIAHMSDYIAVMYLGQIVEYGTRDQIIKNPIHPYTQMLLASTPEISQTKNKNILVKGEIPNPFELNKGCAFYSRCPIKTSKCLENDVLVETKHDRKIACVLV